MNVEKTQTSNPCPDSAEINSDFTFSCKDCKTRFQEPTSLMSAGELVETCPYCGSHEVDEDAAKAPVAAPAKAFDSVGFMISYESGELDYDDTVAGFQHLVDSGLAWQLQGHYGRTATALINSGAITVRSA